MGSIIAQWIIFFWNTLIILSKSFLQLANTENLSGVMLYPSNMPTYLLCTHTLHISSRFSGPQTAWVQSVAVSWSVVIGGLLCGQIFGAFQYVCRDMLWLFSHTMRLFFNIFPASPLEFMPYALWHCHRFAKHLLYVTIAATWLVISQGDIPRLFVCTTFVLKQSPARSLSVILNSGTWLKGSLCGWKHSAVF